MASPSKKTKKKISKKKSLASKNNGQKLTPPESVEFHYMKGPNFQTIHVDGAIGGITPQRLVHLAVFSERLPIPKNITQNISPQGKLGDEILGKRKTLGGIVRQMEVDLFMTPATARRIRDWITARLTELEQNVAIGIASEKKAEKGK